MVVSLRRRSLTRLFYIGGFAFVIYWAFFSSSPPPSRSHQIQEHNFIERATRPDRSLNVQKHKFLQARMGRDERDEILGGVIQSGISDYWERYQVP